MVSKVKDDAVSKAILKAANGNRADEIYLVAMADIESDFDPHAHNPGGTCVGLYQFDVSTGRECGISADQRYDPYKSAKAALVLRDRRAGEFQQAFGRLPSGGESYLMHQQGAAGGIALLSEPDRNVVDVLAKYHGQQGAINVVRGNGGSVDMTAGEFAQKWIDKYDENVAYHYGEPEAQRGSAPKPASDAVASDARTTAPNPQSRRAADAPESQQRGGGGEFDIGALLGGVVQFFMEMLGGLFSSFASMFTRGAAARGAGNRACANSAAAALLCAV